MHALAAPGQARSVGHGGERAVQREADTDVARGEEVDRRDLVEPALSAHRVECGAQEVHVADAGDLGRVLEGQEEPGGGAGFGGALEQVDAVEGDGAGGGVAVAAGEDVGQGALARPVGSHDGVHLAGSDIEVEAAQHGLAGDGGGEVLDVEHQPTVPSRLRRMSAWASTAYSMGSSSNTSRQKPLTIMAVASSSVRPRWRQ